MVKLLIDYGANISNSLLNMAVTEMDIGMIKLLIEHGADIYHKNKYGKSLFQIADEIREPEKREQILNLLLNKELQIAQKHKRQIQKTKQGKRMVSGLIETLPRELVPLRGSRYIYPGGSSYLQAGTRSGMVGMYTTGLNLNYPQGYQQFWKTYQGDDEMTRRLRQSQNGAGSSRNGGNDGYSLRSPKKKVKSVKRSIRKR
jgi:hypothetical protein